MRNASSRDAAADHSPTLPDAAPVPRSRVLAWALWDWGSSAFNAVVTTFVFSTYLASTLFVDQSVLDAAGSDARDPALVRALAENATVISTALAIVGLLVAAVAPILGQRSDGSGRRKFWLLVNTAVVVLAMLGMFAVLPAPSYLWLGAMLLAGGNLFFEFAGVNYNAMLVQVSTPRTVGRVSGFGWGMGYVGGIVLLAILLALFLFNVGDPATRGVLAIPTGAEGGSLDVRLAVLVAALWFAIFALPLLFRVPEIPPSRRTEHVGILRSYVLLYRTVRALAKRSPHVLMFLLASAVFRDGLAAVFTFGAIIAAQVFGFTFTEVLLFGIAANVVAGVGTFVGGTLDDRVGAKNVIIGSLACLVLGGAGVLLVGDAKTGFWVTGLFLCLFVGPIQAASRSFLARITPPGREGEIFGLYATTGRAVSFLAPMLFGIVVSLTGDTRYGIIGIVLVLLLGLLLMLPVKPRPATID
jgi:MFS transporter, UMF1 family